jgi:hypothetical protein
MSRAHGLQLARSLRLGVVLTVLIARGPVAARRTTVPRPELLVTPWLPVTS